VVQVGHGRRELAEVAAKAGRAAGLLPDLGYAHPQAIHLAERLATPRRAISTAFFFTTGGGEAVESAVEVAKQYSQADRQAAETQGDQPGHCLPWHAPGSAGDHRACPP